MCATFSFEAAVGANFAKGGFMLMLGTMLGSALTLTLTLTAVLTAVSQRCRSVSKTSGIGHDCSGNNLDCFRVYFVIVQLTYCSYTHSFLVRVVSKNTYHL